jgi:hypothetical protein
MSKQDVIDYVMETPHNTNRAVLEGLVDTAVEESQVQADWDQNDTSASDYIKNKPTIDTALSSTSENAVQNKVVKTAIDEVQNTVKEYIGSKVSDKELILFSSTENSTKKFKITVNDSGTISAKEVTEGA